MMVNGRWTELLSEAERDALRRGGWGRTAGLGARPALLIIDAQNYMIGPADGHDDPDRFPYACGATGRAALAQAAQLLDRFRDLGLPVLFTRYVQRRGTPQEAALRRKLGFSAGDDAQGLFLDGTFGARIVAALTPQPDEPVIDKHGRSAFFGTDLLALLRARGADSCVVVGGSTSGCVRPTVCDAEQHGFRVVVPEDAVFDRFAISHVVNLFDMQRAQADVIPTAAVMALLSPDRLDAAPQGSAVAAVQPGTP